ncbi:hypothetical protein BZA05DRAFT_394219 [Tricharina praecox]|uniref:uncharacterized protein n=1 Tax=Tricharina praecox TaxID=43433 RepID=UPI0022211EF6|nr:uncharacterized protein BZA05DRAFT_394219 [Tricharina praecox]KAI5854434.1 hypothetical protein BZA05DRAFT_394219 [Tricharina praecox]
MPPEAAPRKPQPYSLHPEAGSRQSQHYSVQPEPSMPQQQPQPQQYSAPPEPAPVPRQSRPYAMPAEVNKRKSQHFSTQPEDYLIPKEAAPPRQSQPYSMQPDATYSMPPEAASRQSQPYSMHSEPEYHSPPPPEAAPRQPQPYSMHREPSYDMPPEAASRQSQSYSMHPEPAYSPPPPEAAPRQSQPYSMHSEPAYSMPQEAAPSRQSQPYSMQPDPAYSIPVETTPRQSQPYSMHKEPTYDKPQEAARQPLPYSMHQEREYSPPPPEAAPRQSQPYSMHREPSYDKPPEAATRQPQPYSMHQEPEYSSPPLEAAPRQSQPYSMQPDSAYSIPVETTPRQSQPYSMQPDPVYSKSSEPALRQPQPYVVRSDSYSSQQSYSKAPETTPRQSQTYSSPTSTASRRANQFAYSSDRPHSRDDLRPSKSPGVTQSPRQPPPPPPPESPHYTHSHSSRVPESPQYAQSQSSSTKSQHSVPATSRFDAPAPSEPAPPSPTQDGFAQQSLVHRPTTPSSEYLSDLIPACPKRRPVAKGVWYGVPGITNFHVCERCYELHVYDTAFIKYFSEIKLADGQKTFCAFNTPRVLNYVWPKTIEENVFEIFKSYAAGRSSIGTCTGMDASAKKGVWYTIKNSPRGGFIACQACYQDVILATPFHGYFGPLEATVSENTISCHVTWPFIEARLLNTPTSSWDEIQRDIEYRLLKVPACPGDKLIKDTGRRWWKPKGTVMPLYICDCCYWDGIYPTVFSGEFDLVVQSRKQAWCCAMSGYQLSTVWQHAAEKKEFNNWLEAANAALSPMCRFEGSSGQIWNVFKDPTLDGFDFCERCTDVFIRPLGFGNRLEKRRYSAEEIIKCDLNPANEYQSALLRELGEAAAWRDFGIVKKYLSQLAPQVYKPPACPGELVVSRSRWWGCQGFNVCEECWLERVKSSPFAPFVKEFDLQGEPEELSCDLGTPDWRYIWQKRCERRDFDSFIEAITLKNKLDDVRLQRVETMEEMREKSRRGLFPDERRRLQGLLNMLQEEERDTTNMLAVLTRV